MVSQTDFATLSPSLAVETQRIFERHAHEIRRTTDQMFARLLVFEWVVLLVIAEVTTPWSWAGAVSWIHPHVWLAAVLGGVIIVPPLLLIRSRSGSTESRHAVAVAQMCVSALLIHLTGGRIESHFHVFGSLAFLSFYRDWRVLVTATVVTTVDHLLRGLLFPHSVFGIAGSDSWRWLEHAAWVLYEDFFLLGACHRSIGEMTEIARREADRKFDALRMEQIIDDRTSALRLSETELRHSRDRAEAANVAKSEFLANMSHEIRTPMSAILGYADLLYELGDISKAPQSRIEAIETIRRNGHHLLNVINDILDLSRIESGKLQVESIACSPLTILMEVESLMHVRAEAKAIDLSIECETSVPDAIDSDPTRIRQILVNLVGNAIKFTERGSVRVLLRLESDDRDYLEFDVVDTGIGFDAATKDRLFQPFVQADTSTTRQYGGTGLGLTISRHLAALLGGDLQVVSSEHNVGSQFRVRLPITIGPHTKMVKLESAGATGAREAVAVIDVPTFPRDVRVLLAEDGPDNQRLVSYYLQRVGIEPDYAIDGLEAVAMSTAAVDARRPYDVILMDMQMPNMDGYEATRVLRSKNYAGPIIAMTAHAMTGDREKCLDAGCSDYISKPINRDRLVLMIHNLLPSRACPA